MFVIANSRWLDVGEEIINKRQSKAVLMRIKTAFFVKNRADTEGSYFLKIWLKKTIDRIFTFK